MCGGCHVERNLWNKRNRLIHLFFIGGTQTPILDFNLSREELLMAPVIASAALYYTESIFLENDALDS